MQIPKNKFKEKLKQKAQIGLWLGMADAYAAEMAATVGYDWLLIDGEHAPNDVRTILSQLQAIAPYASEAVVRPPIGDTVILKQLLDIGVQTLLVPMVETQEQAQTLVDAIHYPPHGIRGVGSALARASLWNGITDYLDKADQEICLLLQIENRVGLASLEAILSLDGVDGIFIGPADLSASMNHRGDPGHPEVQNAIADALNKIKKAGKAAGILYADAKQAQIYIDMGFDFVAVGVDTSLFVRALKTQLGFFKNSSETNNTQDISKPSVY